LRSSLTTQSAPHFRPDATDRWPSEREIPTRGRGALGPVVLLLAAFCAVIVFFPPEGRVAGPLHELIGMLLGRATFMLPVALGVVGVILIVLGQRPDLKLPRRRLAGVGLIALAVAASENLIANGRPETGAGLVGEWLRASLLDLFGAPSTIVLLAVLLGAGVRLVFDLKWPRTPATPNPTDAEG
jgi:amino acid transporter